MVRYGNGISWYDMVMTWYGIYVCIFVWFKLNTDVTRSFVSLEGVWSRLARTVRTGRKPVIPPQRSSARDGLSSMRVAGTSGNQTGRRRWTLRCIQQLKNDMYTRRIDQTSRARGRSLQYLTVVLHSN